MVRSNSTNEQRVQPRRHAYSAQFKLQIVQEALLRPASNRIKPVCRLHPGIEPVQLRKWIRNAAALKLAEPNAKCVASTVRRGKIGSSIDASPAPYLCTSPPRPGARLQDDAQELGEELKLLGEGGLRGGHGFGEGGVAASLAEPCSPLARRVSPPWPLAALASPASAQEQQNAAQELLALRLLAGEAR